MDQYTKAEPTKATADVPEHRLDLNKDTLHDLDAPQDQVKGGAATGDIKIYTMLCSVVTCWCRTSV